MVRSSVVVFYIVNVRGKIAIGQVVRQSQKVIRLLLSFLSVSISRNLIPVILTLWVEALILISGSCI